MSSAGGEPVWIDAGEIGFKISPITGLAGVAGGDWDIDRRHDLTRAVKHRSIVQRYVEGKRWEDTPLFRDVYRRRFRNGGDVRGEASFEKLVAQYYGRVDAMFESLKRHGFRLDLSKDHLPGFFISRDGEAYIGNQGNHRLAMARILNIPIAGRIICKHSLAFQP